jgi:hypothetical protein
VLGKDQKQYKYFEIINRINKKRAKLVYVNYLKKVEVDVLSEIIKLVDYGFMNNVAKKKKQF